MSDYVVSFAVATAQVHLAEGHPVPGLEIQLMARCGWVTSTVKGIIIISTIRSILSQQHISSFSLSPCERRKHPIVYYSHHDDRELKQSCPWIVNIISFEAA